MTASNEIHVHFYNSLCYQVDLVLINPVCFQASTSDQVDSDFITCYCEFFVEDLMADIFMYSNEYYQKLKSVLSLLLLKLYYAHLNTFVQSYDIASEALNNFKKIHYMY